MDMEVPLEWLQSFLTIGQFVQAYMLHNQALDTDKQLHKEGVQQAQALHDFAVDLDKKLFARAVEMEKRSWDRGHVQWGKDRFLDIKQAEREEMRDDWDQKNRRLDSAFVSATLVFGTVVAIAVEGMPPGLTSEASSDLEGAAWANIAEDIGADNSLFIAWGVLMALALALALLGMLFITRAMVAMSRFLSKLNKSENSWWLVRYEDDDGATGGPAPKARNLSSLAAKITRVNKGRRGGTRGGSRNSTAQQPRLRTAREWQDMQEALWTKQFNDGISKMPPTNPPRNCLDLSTFTAILVADGFEFHCRTQDELFKQFSRAATLGACPEMDLTNFLACRRMIERKALDSNYPERLRRYWKIEVRKFYSTSVYCIASSLACSLGALSITLFTRLSLLAKNHTAAVAFSCTAVGTILIVVVLFEIVDATSKPEDGTGLGALGMDPCREVDYQRRWDEFQFIRQFVRGRLAEDTENVVSDLETERERRHTSSAQATTSQGIPGPATTDHTQSAPQTVHSVPKSFSSML